MKISELIKNLNYYLCEYGDMEVDINCWYDGMIYPVEPIMFEYKQFDDCNKLGLQNYPY